MASRRGGGRGQKYEGEGKVQPSVAAVYGVETCASRRWGMGAESHKLTATMFRSASTRCSSCNSSSCLINTSVCHHSEGSSPHSSITRWVWLLAGPVRPNLLYVGGSSPSLASSTFCVRPSSSWVWHNNTQFNTHRGTAASFFTSCQSRWGAGNHLTWDMLLEELSESSRTSSQSAFIRWSSQCLQEPAAPHHNNDVIRGLTPPPASPAQRTPTVTSQLHRQRSLANQNTFTFSINIWTSWRCFSNQHGLKISMCVWVQSSVREHCCHWGMLPLPLPVASSHHQRTPPLMGPPGEGCVGWGGNN